MRILRRSNFRVTPDALQDLSAFLALLYHPVSLPSVRRPVTFKNTPAGLFALIVLRAPATRVAQLLPVQTREEG